MFADIIEYPHAIASVADPCTEVYYPNWSSRGMRPVRCTRPARATLRQTGKPDRRICGQHAAMWQRTVNRGTGPWEVVRP